MLGTSVVEGTCPTPTTPAGEIENRNPEACGSTEPSKFSLCRVR